MTYRNAIYREIGSIINAVQYIEWNLLNKLERDTFEGLTLGQIILLVSAAEILHHKALTELEIILAKRNDLVHQYFKRIDFEKHKNNTQFLQNELRYLEKFNEQVIEFNEWLVK